MKYRLACADFAFPLLEHDQSLQLISMLGFDGVDIGLFEGRSHLWPSREFCHLDSSARKLKEKLLFYQLEPADLFLQTDPDFNLYPINHPHESNRKIAEDWFRMLLEYANIAGFNHVTILPGVCLKSDSLDQAWQRSMEQLKWRLDECKKRGITLGIEAHVGSFLESPHDVLEFINCIPELTLTLDYTHFAYQGLSDRNVEPLIEHASHFHARGACKGRVQVSFENNKIDYDRILCQMNETKYDGYIGIEYVWTDWERCNEVDNISETILFRNYFREDGQRK